jgi:hypothetical protein
MNTKTMTDQELKRNFRALDHCLNELECYGVRDLLHYQEVINELEFRGFEIKTRAMVR